MAYNRYEYETSPRKLEPEYPNRREQKKKSTQNTTIEEKQIPVRQNQKNKRLQPKEERKKIQTKYIFYVVLGFAMLFAISYRNSIINEDFTEIKNLKSELASIEKENTQLEVNIQSNLNLKNVEQSAKELLGMQKLNNKQTVYVDLPRKDYIESGTEEVQLEEEKNWILKLIEDLIGTIK